MKNNCEGEGGPGKESERKMKLTLLGKTATKEAAQHQEHNGGKKGLCVKCILVL